MKKWIKYLSYLVFLLFTILVFLFVYALFNPLPLHKQQIIIYDQNQQILYQNDRSCALQLEDLDPFISEAIITIEDKRFYQHLGFDPLRIGGALLHNLQNPSTLEGGSSITQQYVKNIYLTNTQSVERKIKELIYAIRLEMHYSKEDILESYINSIYYGHGVYGMKEAASFYFDKDVNELTIAETAMLIGIPNGPALYSPYISYTQAKTKRDQILFILYDQDCITKQEYEKAVQEKIHLSNQDYKKRSEKSYYVASVLDSVAEMNLKDELIHVFTYYDETAQNALSSSINKVMHQQDLQTSGIIIEPYTAHILAIQGGNDYHTSTYNRALYSKRQVASTIKPLLYYLALTQGFTPSSTFSSEPTTFTLEDGSTYAPSNYANLYPNKEISMIHAISRSDNIYALKTHLFLGMESLSNALKQFHIEAQANPSLALGTVNLSIYDMSRIYNTFASEGIYNKPSFISHITNEKEVIYENKVNSKQLLNRDETLVLNQALTSTYDPLNIDISYPTMMGKSPKAKTAVKSGTSEWDTWVIGFNPYYTLGIWNGYDDNRVMDKKEYTYGKEIYQLCFNQLMKHKPDIWYEKSNQIIEKKVDPVSGKEDPNGSIYWYLK